MLNYTSMLDPLGIQSKFMMPTSGSWNTLGYNGGAGTGVMPAMDPDILRSIQEAKTFNAADYAPPPMPSWNLPYTSLNPAWLPQQTAPTPVPATTTKPVGGPPVMNPIPVPGSTIPAPGATAPGSTPGSTTPGAPSAADIIGGLGSTTQPHTPPIVMGAGSVTPSAVPAATVATDPRAQIQNYYNTHGYYSPGLGG
jgi:hypothetical protein